MVRIRTEDDDSGPGDKILLAPTNLASVLKLNGLVEAAGRCARRVLDSLVLVAGGEASGSRIASKDTPTSSRGSRGAAEEERARAKVIVL
jgi:hypothetical protein